MSSMSQGYEFKPVFSEYTGKVEENSVTSPSHGHENELHMSYNIAAVCSYCGIYLRLSLRAPNINLRTDDHDKILCAIRTLLGDVVA